MGKRPIWGDAFRARDALASVIGREVTALDPLSEEFRVKRMQPAGFEDWKAVALETNPEIAAQRHAVEVAGEEINNRVPAHFPRIDLVRAITQDKSRSLVLVGIDALTGSIGVQANIPRRRHLRPRHRTASNYKKAKS